MKTIRELYDYRTMISSLIKRELRGRYKGSVLGFAWTFINPLLQLLVYTLVFSTIMRAGIEDYYLFLSRDNKEYIIEKSKIKPDTQLCLSTILKERKYDRLLALKRQK